MRFFIAENFHEKGITGSSFSLDGSMNLTHNGVHVNEEYVISATKLTKGGLRAQADVHGSLGWDGLTMLRLNDSVRGELMERLGDLRARAGSSSADQIARLLATVAEVTFPGAVVPRHTGLQYVYYLVASSDADWRLLRPLGLAFVGRTLSDFDGSRDGIRQSGSVRATAHRGWLDWRESHASRHVERGTTALC